MDDILKQAILEWTKSNRTEPMPTIASKQKQAKENDDVFNNIPLKEKVAELKKNLILSAYIMSEYPKPAQERITFEEFQKLVEECSN